MSNLFDMSISNQYLVTIKITKLIFSHLLLINHETYTEMPEEGFWGQGAFAHPVFDRAVNHIPTRWADHAQQITTGPPNFWKVRRLCYNY